jgi:glucose dehydrogenase
MGIRRRVAHLCTVFGLLVLTASRAGAAPTDQTAVPAPAPAGANWSVYGGNLYNQRYSALDQINTGNVAGLKGAWTYRTGASSAATSFESTPIVVDGTRWMRKRARRSGNTCPI